MIELRKETIYVEGDHGRLAMTYTLQAEPAGALGLEYGITVCDRSSGTSITIQDITNQPLQARALFEKLVAGAVTTLTFRDVVEDFLAAVNRTVPGLIRTEADELSYPLHVLVRYEIEKMLIEEDLEVEKLPQIWNDKYEEYLGVRPSTDREGVLQDIHWSQGSIGYFPSYALGNAFGAQIYHQMKKELPVEKLLEAGNLGEIREYLRKNIHQYGKLKDSRQILRDMTGEDFNPSYYVAYLEEKYGRPEKVQ